MSDIDRTIRLSQAVSTFGVGAIYDILGESLVLCDTTYWTRKTYKGRGRQIKAHRLVEALRASGIMITRLYEPKKRLSEYRPANANQLLNTLPFMRFPRWLFCSSCRHMKKWSFEDERTGDTPVCSFCKKRSKLTPMRFIRICDHGHMADVPWDRWAHSKTTSDAQKTCRSKKLLFVTTFEVKTSGLESVAVKCADCGASRHLGGITAPKALESVGIKCTGRQPWQSTEAANECSRDQHVVQRGAGNVYYPVIKSAITIPPESNYKAEDADIATRIKEDSLFSLLASQTGNKDIEKMLIERLCDVHSCEPLDILKLLHPEQYAVNTSGADTDIEYEEWCALTQPNPEQDDRDSFVTKHITLPKAGAGAVLSKLIDKVVSVIKLREVRVLTEFYRYHPGGDGETESRPVSPDVGKREDWLPATEVFGEGIFITINESALREWEGRKIISDRVRALEERRKDSSFAPLLPTATPRFVLLHTLAHILIRRLAFECGYASASLRERIYCQDAYGNNDARAGILIYTAAGDAEGTLGGLSRQAEASRLIGTLLAALQDAAWCSTDPICMESEGQGLDGLNLASCHACSLVAETSCESFNLLLDRALIVGDSATVPGFFEPVLTSALEASTSRAATK